MRQTVVAMAAGLVLVACGSTSVGSGANPGPSPSSGLGFDITVTEKDHTAAMHVGQKLEVVLHASSGMSNWTHPQSTDESVLAPIVDPAATAARGVTLAAFQARARGDVRINSTAGPACSPGQACPMFVVLYSVMVTVS
ncbi:MAG: hypothetical protein ACREOM_02435 [Candidatus Dormibacteraceae bacterium]